jgi:hypothetical protein
MHTSRVWEKRPLFGAVSLFLFAILKFGAIPADVPFPKQPGGKAPADSGDGQQQGDFQI